MRYIIILSLILVCSCSQPKDNTQKLQAEIDSLQNKLAHVYRPGLGEFMSEIQVHHAKLWYSGNAQNWPLAQFEMDEIKESFDNIKVYCSDRPEILLLNIISYSLDSVNTAIKNKDLPSFKNNFTALTNSCNSCHYAAKHAFNVIKVPDNPPFTNQEYKLQ